MGFKSPSAAGMWAAMIAVNSAIAERLFQHRHVAAERGFELLALGKAGDEDDRQAGMELARRAGELGAVHPGHREVEQREVGRAPAPARPAPRRRTRPSRPGGRALRATRRGRRGRRHRRRRPGCARSAAAAAAPAPAPSPRRRAVADRLAGDARQQQSTIVPSPSRLSIRSVPPRLPGDAVDLGEAEAGALAERLGREERLGRAGERLPAAMPAPVSATATQI